MNGASHHFAADMAAHGLTPPQILADGRIHRFSTNGKKGDTAGGYVLHDDGRAGAGGAYWDWRTGLFATWGRRSTEQMSEHERRLYAARMQQARQQASRERAVSRQRNRERIAALWGVAQPSAEGDLVYRYLRGRGLKLDRLAEISTVLRLHPALEYWDFDEQGKPTMRGTYPAMLAAVQTEEPGLTPASSPLLHTVALHRTYLSPEGGKADVPSPKKLSGAAGDLKGAAIRLGMPSLQHGPRAHRMLGVAEGIETALAAAEGAGLPVWATVSASGMQSFRWPRPLHHLYIFADNDANETGQKAARELARKAMDHGITVRTLVPPTPGTDWADVWQSR